VLLLAGPAPSKLRWLIVDAEAVTNVDYSAARVVRDLVRELTARGVVLAFARVHPALRRDLDRHHITEAVGANHIFLKLHDARDAYRDAQAAPSPPSSPHS
jgi:sulfate permease, SulP family